MVRAVNRVFDEKTWRYSGHTAMSLMIQNRHVQLPATLIAAGSRKWLVIQFYVVNGRVAEDLATVNAERFVAHFLKRPCASALFVLAADAEQAAAVLQRYMNSMQSVRSYVCEASQG